MPYRGSGDPSRGPPLSYYNTSRRQSSGRRRSSRESRDQPRQTYGSAWEPPDPQEMHRRAGMDLPPRPEQPPAYQSYGWEQPQQSSGYQGAYNTRIVEPSIPMPMPMPNEYEPQLRRRPAFTWDAPSYQDEKLYADGQSPGFMEPEFMGPEYADEEEEEFATARESMAHDEPRGFDRHCVPQDDAYIRSRSVPVAPRERYRPYRAELPSSTQRRPRAQTTSRGNGQSSKPYYTTKPQRIRKDSTMVKIAQHLARHW